MYLIRDLMYCKPGTVRPMVDKYIAMARLSEKNGLRFEKIMEGYHDLVDHGKREIYTTEGAK